MNCAEGAEFKNQLKNTLKFSKNSAHRTVYIILKLMRKKNSTPVRISSDISAYPKQSLWPIGHLANQSYLDIDNGAERFTTVIWISNHLPVIHRHTNYMILVLV